MARIVSFVVLLVILLAIAALFFRVMANFLLPMFLAVLLAIIFGPLHRWVAGRCKGRIRLAAGLSTAAIMVVLMVPLAAILVPAILEGRAFYKAVAATAQQESRRAEGATPQAADETGLEGQAEPAATAEPAGADGNAVAFQKWATAELVKLSERAGFELAEDDVQEVISTKLQQWLTPIALGTTQYLAGFVIGLVVMVIALYYFLADGPVMIRTIMRLSPLDDRYERQLIAQFDNMTRAVVVATLLSAFVQGILAGAGFYVAGLGSVFLLMVLAMLLAMVPFVGTPAVWIPACLWIYFYEERTLAAVLLAIYCATLVGLADNVIKPLVLHGRSNLHPLLALLSVLGGVQALGPIGIFVGPMAVAFLQTLLKILHTELASMDAESLRKVAR